MLNIWKQTWRREEGSEVVADSMASTDCPATIEEDAQDLIHPNKKRRLDDRALEEGNDNKISNTLPEIMELDQSHPPRDAKSMIAQPANLETIVATAAKENMIALFDSDVQMLSATLELLKWSSSNEQEELKYNMSSNPRASVVIVENSGLASVRASQLNLNSILSFGIYASSQVSATDTWNSLCLNDVVITPADMFLDALHQGAIALSQFSLIVIDDIQAVKLNDFHPIRSAMQDFYFVTESSSRPRIFASLFVSSVSELVFDFHLLKLEGILDAKVFGVPESAREAISSIPDKPIEIVVFYEPQLSTSETVLHASIRNLDKKMVIPGMRRLVRNARLALSETGACGCDFVWRRSLDDPIFQADDHVVYEEEDEIPVGSQAAIVKARAKVKEVIRNWTFLMPNLDPHSKGFNVTPKVLQLIQILLACKPEGDAFRGIVLVQRRIIAHILADMLRAVDDKIGFLRLQVLCGHGPSSKSPMQNEIIDGFRTGVHNLLICTKHAEELDLTPATLVVRFDLYESYVSYAQCRALGRGKESHLVHMAERGSDPHLRILSQLADLDSGMEKWIQKITTSPASSTPPRPLNDTIDPYRSDSDDEGEDTSQFIRDPTTSGKIYVRDAVAALYRFLASIADPSGSSSHEPLFEYEELQEPGLSKSSYICTVLLPKGTPISRVSGAPSASYASARQLACFQTCTEFFQRGLLDYRLFPRPPLPRSRSQKASYISVQLGNEQSDSDQDDDFMPEKMKQGQASTAGMRCYNRKKPEFWDNSLPVMRGSLYPTIITPLVLADSVPVDEVSGPFSPMVLLTRLPLPSLSAFRIFFSGFSGQVHVARGAAFEVDEDRLKDLYRYTIRLLRFITNKPFVCAPENMAYFLAPLSLDPSTSSARSAHATDGSMAESRHWKFANVSDHIPWSAVQLAANNATITLNSQDVETLSKDVEDALIQDRRLEFTRRYVCVRVRPDLSPLSKPSDSPRERDYENLLEYCRARQRSFEGLRNEKQPLIEVTQTPMVINHLNPNATPTAAPKRAGAKYLIPELCVKCSIPASVFRTVTLLPSIMHRIDEMLLVKEINAKFFDHSIDEKQLHSAITSPSTASDFDYERLELLGDAYLKYLSSVYLFVTFPTQSEGMLHVLRQKIISNKSLLRNSVKCGLPQYIQSKPLTIREWAPPNFHVYEPPKKRREENEAQEEDIQDPSQEKVDEIVEEDAEPVKHALLTAAGDGDCDGPQGFSELPGHLSDTNEPDKSQAAHDGTGETKKKKKKKSMSQKTKRERSQGIQWLGDKCVADVAEAIIGAAYVTKGREIALKVTKALNIPVPHIDRWSDFGRKALAPSPEVTAKLSDGSIEAVEKIIGHKFNHPHLLAQALTHVSLHGTDTTSYERLEFLGDAIVDFLVIRHIYNRHDTLSPGALTLLKGAMVSNSTLAAVCVWAGLHEHLLFESHVLATDIQFYADNLKNLQDAEYTRARTEGRMPGQYWLDVVPPKALSDVVESIVGAVYVSDNFSPIGSEAFFDRVLKPFYDQHITLRTLSHHPTKVLFELFQSQGCQDFEILKEAIPRDADDHTARCSILVHDVVLSSTTETSASSAARSASFMALDAIEGDPGFLPRTCSCRVNNASKKRSKKDAKHAFIEVEDAEEKTVDTVL